MVKSNFWSIMFAIFSIGVLFLILYVGGPNEDATPIIEESVDRIQLIDSKVINNANISIISVDGVEFLCNSNGGIIKLTKSIK